MPEGSNGNPEFRDGETYNVSVAGVSTQESPNKGTPYFQFRFQVTEGEMQGEGLEYQMYMTASRKEALTRELGLFGFDPTRPDADWSGLKEMLIGKECAVTLASDTFNGKTKLKVSALRAKSAAHEAGGVLAKIADIFGGTVKPGKKTEQDKDVPF